MPDVGIDQGPVQDPRDTAEIRVKSRYLAPASDTRQGNIRKDARGGLRPAPSGKMLIDLECLNNLLTLHGCILHEGIV